MIASIFMTTLSDKTSPSLSESSATASLICHPPCNPVRTTGRCKIDELTVSILSCQADNELCGEHNGATRRLWKTMA